MQGPCPPCRDAEPAYDQKRAVLAALGLRVRAFHERDHAGCLEITATKHGEGMPPESADA